MARESSVPRKDYGEPLKYDPTFEGPLRRRSCTDIICLFLFVIFLAAWGFVGWYAVAKGDVRRILAPTDSDGYKCGLDSHVQDRPYLVFFDILACLQPNAAVEGCPTPQVCVKSCPDYDFLKLQIDDIPLDEIISKIVCKRGTPDPRTKEEVKNFMKDKKCAENVFKSKSVSQRCMPIEPIDTSAGKINLDALEDVVNLLSKLNEMGVMIMEDVVNLRWALLVALAVVMIVCLLYIVSMRWLAGPVVWLSIVGVVASLSYTIYLSYDRYAHLKANPPVVTPSLTNANAFAQSLLSLRETWLAVLIVASVVLLIILLTVIFLRKRIVIAIALIKEGSKAVGSVTSTLIFPIFPWVLQCSVLTLAVVVGLHLNTIGEPNYRANFDNSSTGFCTFKQGDACTPAEFNNASDCRDGVCHFVGITATSTVNAFIVLNIIGFFWLTFFIDGLSQMVLASTFATWYWTFKKSDVPFFTLTAGLGRTLWYHLGTVAFGSLIITICRLVRVCLEYLDHKLNKFDNGFTRAVLCCMKCFFKCLESFLKFINKNAYIMCAVHGKGFLSSARDAFSLLMRNILRVFVLDKVTDFLFFLSKLIVAIGCGVAAYFTFTSSDFYELTKQDRLHYDLVPVFIVAVAAYLIASIFFSVYSMAVDTLFLCFLEDCERNDGSREKPYFMSKQLLRILGKANKMK